MFVGITNTPRDYPWGSTRAIADLLGTEPTGGPQAELWLGAHPLGSSRLADDPQTELLAWLDRTGAAHPPFLLKVLAAAAPLSLQAHPDPEQARAGFERENALGVALTDPARNYKDPFAKPEMIVALSERFRALCGFRPTAESRADLELLRGHGAGSVDGLLARMPDDASLPGVVGWLLSGDPAVRVLVEEISAASQGVLPTTAAIAVAFPGDPGIAVALLLNEVVLSAGEALFLPAGNIHAYLEGLGIELMGPSDNVLRGGLTPKHVDAAELQRVLDFRAGPPPYLPAEQPAPGVTLWRPKAQFRLAELVGPASLAIEGPSIGIVLEGPGVLSGAVSSIAVDRGTAVYATPDEGTLTLDAGRAFVATTA